MIVRTYAPIPRYKYWMPLMNNSASAWCPHRGACAATYYAHFRGFDKTFFRKRIGTITVRITAVEGNYVYVPFRNLYSSFNDRVSSFFTWGSFWQ